MATTFDIATEARVLGDPAGANVEVFEQRAHAMLAPVLRSADASAGMRSVAQSLLGAQLQSKEQIGKLTAALDTLSEICERTPRRLDAIERRLRDLECRHA